MTFLLDTHALLWWLTDSNQLSRLAFETIRSPENRILVSPANAWEICTKYRLGKLPLPETHATNLENLPRNCKMEVLEISWAHSSRAGSWLQNHRDPFDRLLAAQSSIESIPLISSDRTLDLFGIQRVW